MTTSASGLVGGRDNGRSCDTGPSAQLGFIFSTPRSARARHNDPKTSHLAAASVEITVLESAVLRALAKGPATTEELARRLDMSLVTVSPRLKPLEEKGAVCKVGRMTNRSGRTAIAWKLTLGDTSSSAGGGENDLH